MFRSTENSSTNKRIYLFIPCRKKEKRRHSFRNISQQKRRRDIQGTLEVVYRRLRHHIHEECRGSKSIAESPQIRFLRYQKESIQTPLQVAIVFFRRRRHLRRPSELRPGTRRRRSDAQRTPDQPGGKARKGLTPGAVLQQCKAAPLLFQKKQDVPSLIEAILLNLQKYACL